MLDLSSIEIIFAQKKSLYFLKYVKEYEFLITSFLQA